MIQIHVERRVHGGAWSHVELPARSSLHAIGTPPLFAVLGDVCNDDPLRGDPYRPISGSRGLPVDVTAEVRRELGSNVHSPSWLSLRELVDFDWAQIASRRGVVFAPTFAAWDDAGGAGAPHSYCRWVLSASHHHIDNDAMRLLITRARAAGYPMPVPPAHLPIECPSSISPELHDELMTRYTTVEWRETYATSCRPFVEHALPELLALGSPDDVRIVFFFYV